MFARFHAEEYPYDTAGDVVAKRLSVWKGGQCAAPPAQITANFNYDSEGKLIGTVYPSVSGGSANTTALNTYDSMSRLQGVSTTEKLPSSGPCNDAYNGAIAWASSANYTVANQLASFTRFSGVYQSPSCVDNFLTANEFFKYNVNNQLADIETNVASTGGLRLQNPQMDGSNYILAGYNYSATQNNGQITSMQDGREGYSVTYQYDLLKRLVSATAGSSWTQTFGYDGFGNLTSKSTPSGSSETPLPGVNAAKNWLSGYSYDQNGNVGSYNSFALGYDPASRLSYATTGSFTETYGYDAANHRIERVNSSLDTVYFFSPSGKLLSMFNCLSTCTLISNRVYFGGMLLGTDGTPGQGVTLDANFDTFTWTDRLGSAQPTYPYGADIGTPPAADAPDFATYTKEGTTGLEYAMNRYYSASLGRFMTVDPYGGSADTHEPGSLNRFSYSNDDPINYSDPSGTTTCDSNGDNCSDSVWVTPDYLLGLGVDGNDPSKAGADCLGPVALEKGSSDCRNTEKRGRNDLGLKPRSGDFSWANAQQRLTNAASSIAGLLSSPDVSGPCARDLAALGVAPGDGGNASALLLNLTNSSLRDGLGSQDLYSTVFPNALPSILQGWNANGYTVGSYFNNNTAVTALSQLGTPTAPGTVIWFDATWVNGSMPSTNAGTLLHELLHHFGLQDPQIEGALGIKGPSVNISTTLAKDCF